MDHRAFDIQSNRWHCRRQRSARGTCGNFAIFPAIGHISNMSLAAWADNAQKRSKYYDKSPKMATF
jgi:hypothetical protein